MSKAYQKGTTGIKEEKRYIGRLQMAVETMPGTPHGYRKMLGRITARQVMKSGGQTCNYANRRRMIKNERIPTNAQIHGPRPVPMGKSLLWLYRDGQSWIARTLDMIGPRNCLLPEPPAKHCLHKISSQDQSTWLQRSLIPFNTTGSSTAVLVWSLMFLPEVVLYMQIRAKFSTRNLAQHAMAVTVIKYSWC